MEVLKNTPKRIRSSEDEGVESIDERVSKVMKNSSKAPPMMEKLISSFNKIQDVFNTLKVSNTIQLPQIVMLGPQSAGKSSVLESIVHRPFLPRGSGIVTRCPLELKLIECKLNDTKYRKDENGTSKIEEWGEFLHLKGQIFTDFEKIREEIEHQTDKLAGSNKGICSDPISLTIYSPHVVTLTLVDLPGITKVPVGDQPEDIENQIMNLVMKYIKNQNSIILAVSAANVDIATSESLKYAKQVDPEGLRTLAILTKIDLMDHGTDAWDMLTGKTIPVKLGIIGIINRSQKDINEKKTIDSQIRNEKEYFEKNYELIAPKNGIPYLSIRLSDLLYNHILKCLPKVKAEILDSLRENEKIYELCSEEINDRGKIINRIIFDITKGFTDMINGKFLDLDDSNVDLYGGPKIREIFDISYSQKLNNIQPNVQQNKIIQHIRISGGPRPSVFAPESLLQDLVNKEIQRLRGPSIECVENIHSALEDVMQRLILRQQEFNRFPQLEGKVRMILKMFLNGRLPIAIQYVNELIDTELSSVNTNHPDFSIENALLENANYRNRSSKNNCDAMLIQKLVENYFPVVRKTVIDQVPKIIMHKIINYIKNNIQGELWKKLYDMQEDLFQESVENIYKRQESERMIKAMKMAKETIMEIEEQC